jgi:hypothetical protein
MASTLALAAVTAAVFVLCVRLFQRTERLRVAAPHPKIVWRPMLKLAGVSRDLPRP